MNLNELLLEKNRLREELASVEKQIEDIRFLQMQEHAGLKQFDVFEYRNTKRPQDNYVGKMIDRVHDCAFHVIVRKKDGTFGNKKRYLYLSDFEYVTKLNPQD